MEMWRRRREAASAGHSAALYSVYHSLYSEAVVSSVASAVALVEVGRFREAVEYVQKAAKTLYEPAKDVFERVEITVQCLVELFVEAVTRVLAWVDEDKAYLFLMAAAAGWGDCVDGCVEHMGSRGAGEVGACRRGCAVFAGLADTGGKAAERFKTLAERWKVNDDEKQKIENIIKGNYQRPSEGRNLSE
jgi:hypothetical protein